MPAPSPTAVAGPIESAAASPKIVLHASDTAPASRVAAPAAGEIDAVFTYSADSWTEVYDATGRRLLYGMSTGRETRKLQGVPPLSVMLGDASDVTIEVGGRAAGAGQWRRKLPSSCRRS